ncbi:MAG: PAS domain-containing protein [Deltaproteobacteria bacterium]|jgi:signal transduction histidine kinase|nr:PAS domain-containing protein [Deltaproteobacteria bacterium]MBW2467786.1 PAS domain-containing protein [Deltaproteobacteria bacterium]MBW2488893.1 PAS domain-containing protein [Deltaproteobacteria bacterium]MBW2518112.1 PAS domain-containing protein [Deltaproteobacteria bacterium]
MVSKTKRPEIESSALPAISGLKLDQLVDYLPCYVSIQDPNLQIIFVNANFKRDFGDGVGKKCHTVYKCSEDICPNCPVQKTFQDRRPHIADETVQLANGKICQILIQTSPIVNADGDVWAVIEMATNITRVKKKQKELASLGQSIALLSHGIKNILEGLQGGAYVVDEGFKDKDFEMARKGWNIVNKNIFDITDVVQNILYSSKDRPLKYERVSPAQLARDSLALFRDKAASLNVELKPKINNAIPKVRLDIASIRRMLNNLIWNALEACLHDGQKNHHAVSVKTDFHDDGHFMFEVADNGVGMDPDTQRNIYEEFFSTKGSSGTGLGLAVVEKVVNRHGGRIEVTSAPGKGTCFTTIFKIT